MTYDRTATPPAHPGVAEDPAAYGVQRPPAYGSAPQGGHGPAGATAATMDSVRRFLDHDGTPEGQLARPEYRHGTVRPEPWFVILFNPGRWRVGGWALFGAFLTLLADFIAFLYISNILGIGAKVEIEMWLLISGLTGFATITAALWAIWKDSRRVAGIWALALGLAFGAAPAWLVGNTLIQLLLNGGQLPVAPPLW